MFKIKMLFVLSLCAISLIARAQIDDMKPVENTAAIIQQLKKVSLTTTTIDADFEQKKHLSFMSEDIISSGHFNYKKERKIRWEYKQPFNYIIVINGNDIFLKDDEKTNHFDAQSNKMFQGINDMMTATVNGDILNSDKYESGYFENDKYYFVRLEPKESELKGYLKHIEIYFNKSDLKVEKLKLTELNDDYTFVEYYNQTINQAIKDEVFFVD